MVEGKWEREIAWCFFPTGRCISSCCYVKMWSVIDNISPARPASGEVMVRVGVTAMSCMLTSGLTFPTDKCAHVKTYAVQRCCVICDLRAQAHHRSLKFPSSVYHLVDLFWKCKPVVPSLNWKIAVHSKAKYVCGKRITFLPLLAAEGREHKLHRIDASYKV